MEGGKSSNSCLVVLFGIALIASSIALCISESTAAPEPGQGNLERMKQCMGKVSPNCGKEVFQSTFFNGTVSTKCCAELVKMGKACHDEINLVIAHSHAPEARLREVIAKSDQVYNKCASIVV